MTSAENYLGGILGFIIPVQQLDMLGNDVIRVLMFTKKGVNQQRVETKRNG
jgi:hypothetical protein